MTVIMVALVIRAAITLQVLMTAALRRPLRAPRNLLPRLSIADKGAASRAQNATIGTHQCSGTVVHHKYLFLIKQTPLLAKIVK